ncbi:hypothetical protein SAMN05216366_104122 [Selenomonas ruminantium]|jgi:hypothetical protein|uniref:Uncharacterized protein n=1 Tax=Selenomonas ruminantium TaxID=971 RepID=A0A1H0P6G4_SELRU|nr:hypothetical protein SAMN05216366_104122 [Selenomonas ruminantium]
MGDKEDKRAAFQIAHMVNTKYCELCPVSDGCKLSFYKDGELCWHRFHEWYRSVSHDKQKLETGS